MSGFVLGISAFYHDSAAALVRDGEIVAAVQEERFSRKKHDPRFPANAVDYCLGEAFLEVDDLDAVVFYDNPVLTLDRALQSLASSAPGSRPVWERAAIPLVGTTLAIDEVLRHELGSDTVPLLFSQHHLSHAASAFFPSPFERAAVLSMDGVGEWATTSLARGEGTDLQIFAQIDYPHSLGLLYSAFTSYCGFKVNSGEYKLMGLAPYGEPRFESLIRDHLIDLRPDGSYHLDLSFFGFLDSERMVNERFEELFGGPARTPESQIERRHMDLAASIQAVTETAVLGLARHAREVTGLSDLCLAGGVALNCVANGLLERERIFERIWIQPAAGDAGGALGAALLASHQHIGAGRTVREPDGQRGSYLGIRYGREEVRAVLDDEGAVYAEIPDLDERSRIVADHLSDGRVVGFFNGPMEFGPRALGGRSIVGDPRNAEMQVNMNLQIKYRESFRPFAPSVLEERAADYFELDATSPYMLLVAPVRKELRVGDDGPLFDGDVDADMLDVVRRARSTLPAITHVDHSARIQTVGPDHNPAYRRLLECFDELTGCGVVVNTSFNVRGEPIVASPRDAHRCFMRTEMDVLVVEDFLLIKSDQPQRSADDSWMDEFELD